MSTDAPTIDDLRDLPPQEQRLLVALWPGLARSITDLQSAVPEFGKVSPATLARYCRNLSDRLESTKRGWLESGSTVLHGRWVRLVRSGRILDEIRDDSCHSLKELTTDN